MFIVKKNYFLLIESIKDINLKNIKKKEKFIIIYRNKKNIENISNLLRFRKLCKTKKIRFYVANDNNLATKLLADGLYISANNFSLTNNFSNNYPVKIIGSAHNLKEYKIKKLQKCTTIIFSRLFRTSYTHKKGFLGIVKFNLISKLIGEEFVPLGGIKVSNLNKLFMNKAESFVILSEVKKKPAIFDRLF